MVLESDIHTHFWVLCILPVSFILGGGDAPHFGSHKSCDAKVYQSEVRLSLQSFSHRACEHFLPEILNFLINWPGEVPQGFTSITTSPVRYHRDLQALLLARWGTTGIYKHYYWPGEVPQGFQALLLAQWSTTGIYKHYYWPSEVPQGFISITLALCIWLYVWHFIIPPLPKWIFCNTLQK